MAFNDMTKNLAWNLFSYGFSIVDRLCLGICIHRHER